MRKKIYYHNELSCKISRSVKRKFMEICDSRNQSADELMRDIIVGFVNRNIPKTSFDKALYEFRGFIMRNRHKLSYIYTMLAFLLLGAILGGLMMNSQPDPPTVFIAFTVSAIVIFSARILYESGRKKARSEVK